VTPDGGPPYLVYLVSGLFAWMWANSAISESTGALTSQARLITTMGVPRELFPLGRVVGRFAEYLAGLPVIVVVALAYHAHLTNRAVLALPLAVLLEGLLLTGVSLTLAAVNVLLRDVERVIRLVLRVLFYAAPVIYPMAKVTHSGIPAWGRVLYELNPFVGILQLHHAVWYPTEFPGTRLLVASVVGSVTVFLSGLWIFRTLEPTVLKEL